MSLGPVFTHSFARLTVLVVASVVASAGAFAADADEKAAIAEKMQTRFQGIHKLRTECKVAEYATGYLGPLPEEAGPGIQLTPEEKERFTEENKDRKSMYGLLAAEAQIKEEEIGKLRAELMREQIGIGKAGGNSVSQKTGDSAPIWLKDSVPVRKGDRAPFWVQVPLPDGSHIWVGLDLPQDPIPRWVLTAPDAVLYTDADANGTVLEPNIAVFEPYKVKGMKRQADGEKWFLVDFDQEVGWFRESNVLPWDHRLVAAYRNPTGRSPVCFFRVEQSIAKLAGLSAEERELKVADMEKSLRSSPGGSELVAMEPKIPPTFIKTHPYLMPIIRTGKLYEIKGKAPAIGENAPTFKVNSYEMASSAGVAWGAKPDAPAEPTKPKLDLVFVMDTTGTMQPYIDQLLEQVKKIAGELNKLDPNGDRFRFALWGYQDLTSKPGIQYNTKLFTAQDRMVTADELASVLAHVKANKVTGDEFEEDVLSGLADAIGKSPWRRSPDGPGAIPRDDPNVIRIIIHCGDAPPLPPTEKNRNPSACGTDEIGVRALADQKPISIVSIQIRDENKYSGHKQAADLAFGVLTKNRGVGQAAMLAVPAGDTKVFATKLETVVSKGVINFIQEKANGIPVPTQPEPITESSPQVSDEDLITKVMEGAFDDLQGATKPGEPPRFRRCWALERDLKGANALALDIQVVLSRKELNNLQTTLDDLVNEAKEESQPIDFTGLRANVAKAIAGVFLDTKEPTAYDLARLPVKSQVLGMNAAIWAQMTSGARATVIESWQAKLKHYQNLYNDPKAWFLRNKNPKGDEDERKWINIPLEMFP